jgi:anti-sigma regulatory factor (Ser/Thr protein kinase)/anti-anti-sigma regulatory factor
LIAAQRVSPIPAPFEARLPASPEILAGLRRDLGAWLAGTGAGDEDVWRVQLAVGEAVTNCIDHAYASDAYPESAGSGGGGQVLIEGYHDPDGRACFTISDRGEWRAPPVQPDARGRGLIMIRACMDTVEVERTPAGTTVLMDRLLGRKPVFASADDSGPGPDRVAPQYPFQVELDRSQRPRLIVRGSVDANTIDEFRRQLQAASRGGALPLELDLSRLEVLASAGVQALHELAEQMAADNLAARLIAPPGCPARYVLQLTGLDHLIVADRPAWTVPRPGGVTDSMTVRTEPAV